MRHLPRRGRQRQRSISSASRSALSLHCEPIDELGQGACGGKLEHHGADRAWIDQVTNRSGRGLCKLSGVTLFFGPDHQAHRVKNGAPRERLNKQLHPRAAAVESGEEAMNLSYRRNSATPLNETIGRRFMKAVSLQTTLQLTFLAIVLSAMGRADAKDTAAVSKQEVQAKVRYCQDCHGLSGQGFRGFFPIPRLAGQQPEYLKNQLQAFVERRRTNNIMFNVAHVLKPAMIEAIATSFQQLNPKPLGGAPKKLVAAGKNIFENGIPDANVAACAACHGPEATGHGEIPRLAGQLDSYVVMELTTWTHERGQNPANPDTSAIMKPVAHSLTKPQIEAVAAYVSSLK